MRVFAYLNLDHVPTAWAVMRGMLISARCSPSYGPGCVSFMLAGMILHGDNQRLLRELIIEDQRSKNYPLHASRLEGLYFFESRSAALRIAGAWGGHFIEKNLYELEFHPISPPTRLDSDWITFEGDLSDRKWIDDYWLGKPRSAAPTWEVIGHGIAAILDNKARARAYDVVNTEFPDCWIAIEMARIACEMDASPAGSIAPWLIKDEGDAVSLTYLLRDAEYHDEQTIKAMARHQDFGRLAARWKAAEAIMIPGFAKWIRKFRINWTQVPFVAAKLPLIRSLH